MSIIIGEHVFDGPFQSTQELANDPGVFAVIVANGDSGTLIDVGESSGICDRVLSHPDRPKWQTFSSAGTICYAVLYTPTLNQIERKTIEKSIRTQYSKGK